MGRTRLQISRFHRHVTTQCNLFTHTRTCFSVTNQCKCTPRFSTASVTLDLHLYSEVKVTKSLQSDLYALSLPVAVEHTHVGLSVYRPLVSIRLCLRLPTPSCSRCTCILRISIDNKKLSYCWETVRRESMPRMAEMDVEMTT